MQKKISRHRHPYKEANMYDMHTHLGLHKHVCPRYENLNGHLASSSLRLLASLSIQFVIVNKHAPVEKCYIR